MCENCKCRKEERESDEKYELDIVKYDLQKMVHVKNSLKHPIEFYADYDYFEIRGAKYPITYLDDMIKEHQEYIKKAESKKEETKELTAGDIRQSLSVLNHIRYLTKLPIQHYSNSDEFGFEDKYHPMSELDGMIKEYQETLERLEKIESERPKPKSLIQKIKENTNFFLDVDEYNKLKQEYNSLSKSKVEALKRIQMLHKFLSENRDETKRISDIIKNIIEPEMEKIKKQLTEIHPDICLLNNIIDKVKNFKELIIAFDYKEDRWQNTFFLINKRDRFVVKELMLNSEDKEDTNINTFIENALSITLKKYEAELIRRGMLKEEKKEFVITKEDVSEWLENKIYQAYGTDKRSIDIEIFMREKLEENGIDPDVHNEELSLYIKNNFKLEKYEVDGKVIEVIKFKDLDFLKL